MLRLGEIQTLRIARKVDFGVYLSDEEGAQEVLLPNKYIPENTGVGDTVEVFVYRDSQDRMIATTLMPKLTIGQTARLKVVQVGKIGAFLDWGLEKDLFLPYRQQTHKVSEGEEVLVGMYIDKSGRLCATMNVYRELSSESPYQKDDQVSGTVYEIHDRLGAFVAVDEKYSALIPKKELFGVTLAPGDKIEARVAQVREDGKLNLSVRRKSYLQIEEDSMHILQLLEKGGGSLPFNDKASPGVITERTGMSKNEFKRAVGHLLKEKKIVITEKGIRLS
ncbi:MAG: S1-like domain-containing RNA-binding protein [Lachnospiraceae bacterium]|nr:S1-like domain-containing RNA-binding protein [Lachnospiraceae bacterium]